jgi:hypothetical protein
MRDISVSSLGRRLRRHAEGVIERSGRGGCELSGRLSRLRFKHIGGWRVA